jgi:hypothetical protein
MKSCNQGRPSTRPGRASSRFSLASRTASPKSAAARSFTTEPGHGSRNAPIWRQSGFAPHIATFNSAIGTTCPFPNVWYYGLDSSPPGTQIDFVSVLVHELSHGLGFLTFVDLASGAKLGGFNDTFMRFLENHGAVPPDYPSMTNAQRVAASTATGNLHWIGPNVRAASSILTAGRVGDHVRMFAPNPQQSGSSVSHWDTVLAPNQVMEPVYTGPLHSPVLELPLFQDIGWTLLTPPPPPPPPPPTAGACTLASQLGDFNGDRRDDILFFRASDGYLAEYLMNGVQIVAANVVGSIGSGYTVAAVADFNGDGLADILFRRNSDGLLALFLMNGAQVIGAQVVGAVGTEFDVVGAADFNGDGRADILFRRNTDGMFSLFLMNGAQIVAGQILGALGTEWRVRGVRDFNGDGRADILFRRNTDGMLALYEYSGFQLLAAQLLGAVGTDFDVAGVRDFNGDGRADILFRRASDGMVAIFLMNGFQVLATQLIGAVGTDIRVQGLGDFNADGRADMLFRRVSDGLMAIYLMNGFQVVTAQNIGAVGTELTICYGQPPLSPAQVSQR